MVGTDDLTFRDANLDVSLLRREAVRSCEGLGGGKMPILCQRSGEKNTYRTGRQEVQL